jgi:trk system potassium uptake protein TrkA
MQYVVIGLGTFGMKVIHTLTEHGADVVAIDRDKEKVEQIKDKAGIALVMDSTDETAMRAAGIEDVDAAVIALGDAQEQAILTTAILKGLGVYPIIARATDALYAHVLKLVGADQVIIIEEQMGETLAKRLLAPEIRERIFLTTGHSLAEIEVRKSFVGKTLMELDIRKKYGVNVIAIQRKVTRIDEEGKVIQTTEMNDLPGPGDRIQEDDVLVVVGAEGDIERLALSKERKS